MAEENESTEGQEGGRTKAALGVNARSFQPNEGEVDIRRVVVLLWRRRILIFSLVLIFVSLTAFFLMHTKEVYTAKALVMLDKVASDQAELNIMLKKMSIDTSIMLGEVEVLKSRIMARKVIERLGLMDDPEFSQGVSRDLSGRDDYVPEPQNGSFRSLKLKDVKQLAPETADVETGAIIDRFLKKLTVRPVSGSYVIQVFFESEDPRKAALVTNTIVDLYIEERLEEKLDALQKVNRWLDKRIETLRAQVRSSEAAVEEYRALHGLLKGVRSELTAQQLTELSSQLVLAKAKLAEAQARMANIRDWASNPEALEASVEAMSSNMVQQLRQQDMELSNTLAELSTRYGERHPKLIALRAEREEVRQKISQEMRRVALGIETEMKVANARVDALASNIDELETRQQAEGQAMIRLRELEREAESTRMIFDTFLESYKRSDKKEQLQDPEARVISYASVPVLPSYPNKPLFILLSLVVSLSLGIMVSLLLEKLDNAFRSAMQLETFTGYPCFGLVPKVEGKNEKAVSEHVVENPASSLAEALRALRMAINLRSRGGKPRVIAITSSFPGEGKTTLSVWMARLAAKSGEKVIVIDCDLRRPRVHRAFGRENDVSLVEYLTGQAKLVDTVYKDKESGADVIFGRAVPASALDLLNSGEMTKLLGLLRKTYDLVILDSPACLAVADARLLAMQADYTLYAVSWDNTPRDVVTTGVKQFTDIGYENLAFIMTNVDVRRHISYGYGDSAYYYSRYKEYYSS